MVRPNFSFFRAMENSEWMYHFFALYICKLIKKKVHKPVLLCIFVV